MGVFSFFILRAGLWLLPGIRAGSPARRAAGVRGGLFPFFFSSCAGWRLLPGIRAWSPARRAAGGRGLRSPLPPTTPYPALGSPSLTDSPDTRGVPWPPPCRAAAGVRPPAVPRPRGTSVRPASELPPHSGRRSPPRPAALTSTNGIVVPASQVLRRPLMRVGKNGFPLMSRCNGSRNRWASGETIRLAKGVPVAWRVPRPSPSFMPPGTFRRAPARLHQQSGTVVPASQVLRRPLMRVGRNGFPLMSRCNGSRNRWASGETIRVAKGVPVA